MKRFRTIWLSILMVFLLVSTVVATEVHYIDDDDLGLIKFEWDETEFEELQRAISGQAFALFTDRSSVALGDPVQITLGLEIPCEDSAGNRVLDENIESSTLYVELPDGTQRSFSISRDLKACQSTSPLYYTQTATQVGTWKAHYVIRQSVYPQMLTKETVSWTVVDDSPQCDEEDYSEWNYLYDVNNGKAYNRYRYTYDTSDCSLESSKQFYKTTCDSGFVVDGSESQNADYIANCVEPSSSSGDADDDGQGADDSSSGTDGGETSTCEDQFYLCEDGQEIQSVQCVDGTPQLTDNVCSDGTSGDTDDQGGNDAGAVIDDLTGGNNVLIYTFVGLAIIALAIWVVPVIRKKMKGRK